MGRGQEGVCGGRSVLVTVAVGMKKREGVMAEARNGQRRWEAVRKGVMGVSCRKSCV